MQRTLSHKLQMSQVQNILEKIHSTHLVLCIKGVYVVLYFGHHERPRAEASFVLEHRDNNTHT